MNEKNSQQKYLQLLLITIIIASLFRKRLGSKGLLNERHDIAHIASSVFFKPARVLAFFLSITCLLYLIPLVIRSLYIKHSLSAFIKK
ncbi:hypothetical protein AXW37_08440 [Yersinia ruckeri]|nr:hypothetical protein UGYR_02110 [Yersinia ruckeri]AUQ43042.1 hypothetical protein NJ56_14695 [Yersinia ruckeri]OEU25400.1 hypothetical protein BI323_03640 [Yersinia ruckeri]OIX36698.1 hypothetical protein AXW19_08080 [Yersinia ruckeri]OIX37066.1 hypothetical protein AXW20_08100 [Yersinia ruckeri]